jgi:hypothetical protein
MIYNLLFICFIAISNSSLLTKRCFRLQPPVVPPTPQPPVVLPPAPQPPVVLPPAPQPPVVLPPSPRPPVVLPPAPQPPVVLPPAPRPPVILPPAPQPPVILPPAPQPPVVVPPHRLPPVAPINPQVETGNPTQPLKNGACFYMVNVLCGETISYGAANSLEVKLSVDRTANEVVCVENGPNNAYFIHWKVNYNQVFDIYGGGNTDGVRLIKYPKHGGPNQQFRFIRNNLGQYMFIAVNSGKAFGVWGNGIPVAQSTPRPEKEFQFWDLLPYVVLPPPAPRSPVVLPPPAPRPPVVLPPPVAPVNTRFESGNPNQPLKNGACFYMVSVQNGQAVSFGNGSIEITLSNARSGNEVVCVENGPNNAYFIHWRRQWNLIFDIYGGGNADGVRLIKYNKHGGVNQQFRFVRNNLGQYQFVAVNSGKAFGLWSGTPVAQSTPRVGNPSQLWNLIPA